MQNSTTAFTIVQFPVGVRVQRYFTTVYSIFPLHSPSNQRGPHRLFIYFLSSSFFYNLPPFKSVCLVAPPAVVSAPTASLSDADVRLSSVRRALSQRVKCLFNFFFFPLFSNRKSGLSLFGAQDTASLCGVTCCSQRNNSSSFSSSLSCVVLRALQVAPCMATNQGK